MNKNMMVLGLALSLAAGAVGAAGKDKDVTYVVEVRSNIVGEKANVMSGVLGADRPSAELNRTREVSYVQNCTQSNKGTELTRDNTWDGVRISARLNADGDVTVAVDKRELTALENFRNPNDECFIQVPKFDTMTTETTFSAYEIGKSVSMIVDQDNPITITVRAQK